MFTMSRYLIFCTVFSLFEHCLLHFSFLLIFLAEKMFQKSVNEKLRSKRNITVTEHGHRVKCFKIYLLVSCNHSIINALSLSFS